MDLTLDRSRIGRFIAEYEALPHGYRRLFPAVKLNVVHEESNGLVHDGFHALRCHAETIDASFVMGSGRRNGSERAHYDTTVVQDFQMGLN